MVYSGMLSSWANAAKGQLPPLSSGSSVPVMASSYVVGLLD
jgi:hypothetical protein